MWEAKRPIFIKIWKNAPNFIFLFLFQAIFDIYVNILQRGTQIFQPIQLFHEIFITFAYTYSLPILLANPGSQCGVNARV